MLHTKSAMVQLMMHPKLRSGAIFDVPICAPGLGFIINCFIALSLKKVLIILMLGSLLEVH